VTTTATGHLARARLARTAPGTGFIQSSRLVVPGRLRRAVVLAGDLMGTVAVALCVPFVILAIGTPIALLLRLLLWVGKLL
jgi:hypothetical protein